VVPSKKPGQKEEDTSDDPIAKSLKERMDAGGLGEVVSKDKAGKGSAAAARRPSMIKQTATTAEESKAQPIKTRPGTALPTSTKPALLDDKKIPTKNVVAQTPALNG